AGLERWEAHLRDGLTRMKTRGTLREDADPAALATATMATSRAASSSPRSAATPASSASPSTQPARTSASPPPDHGRDAPASDIAGHDTAGMHAAFEVTPPTTGLVLGAAQGVALRRDVPVVRWLGPTAVGLAVGLPAATAAVPSR